MTEAKRVLDRGVGTDLQRVSILFGLCSATTLLARMQTACELAQQIIEVSERQDDPIHRLVAYRMLGTISFLQAGTARRSRTCRTASDIATRTGNVPSATGSGGTPVLRSSASKA